MIRNELKNKELYNLLEPVVRGAGYFLVELSQSDHHQQTTITAVIQSDSGNTSIGDCTSVHKIIFPRLELLLESRDVYLEVSTPGIQRNIKDTAEFKAFVGKNVKVLVSDDGQWIEGRLFQVTENSIMIHTGDKQELELSFDEIRKAKLVYNWEETK